MRYPTGLPRRYRKHWAKPWTTRARLNPGYRRWLERHGYLTPHYRKDEARCKDPQRSPIPPNLNRGARNHAFNLEQLRHELGDHPIPVLSWYRTPAWNRQVGGASQSQHMTARATDIDLAVVNRLGGRAKFDAAANKVFRDGGLGQYPGGNRHVDSRGFRARWTSF